MASKMKDQTNLYSSWQARKIIYLYTSFCLQVKGILNDINKQDTFFLDCKHYHIMKRGAPPDKLGVLHNVLPIEFHGFTTRIDF